MIGLLLQKNFMQKFCKRAQKELAPILPSAAKDSASRIQSSLLEIVETQPVLFKFSAKLYKKIE